MREVQCPIDGRRVQLWPEEPIGAEQFVDCSWDCDCLGLGMQLSTVDVDVDVAAAAAAEY